MHTTAAVAARFVRQNDEIVVAGEIARVVSVFSYVETDGGRFAPGTAAIMLDTLLVHDGLPETQHFAADAWVALP